MDKEEKPYYETKKKPKFVSEEKKARRAAVQLIEKKRKLLADRREMIKNNDQKILWLEKRLNRGGLSEALSDLYQLKLKHLKCENDRLIKVVMK